MRTTLLIIMILWVSTAGAISQEEIKEAYHKSYHYEKVEDYANAIKAMSEVIGEYPDGYTVNLRLGWLYYLNGNYANSIVHYTTAMKANPYSLEAKLGYSLPLLAQGKYVDVEAMMNQVINTDHYNYTANLRLAYVLRLQEKNDLAEDVLEKMLPLYPIDVSFMVEQGLNKFAQKDTVTATAIFWDVLILDPENTTAKIYFGENGQTDQ